MPGRPLSLLVVWEPVLLTDLGRPASSALSRVSDPRAAQFWDADRRLSRALVAHARAAGMTNPEGRVPEEGEIVWDYVALFGAGPLWGDAPPETLFHAFPVVSAAGELQGRLEALAP